MQNRGRSIRGRIGEKIAGARDRAKNRAHTTRAYITRKPPGTRRAGLAMALTALMIASLFAPFAGAIGVADASTGPAGLEKAPSDNFAAHEAAGPSDHALANVPTSAAAWDIHASDNAHTLETTVDATGDQLRIVFGDDRNHAGREVAVDADALEQSLGERPEIAFGLHESGDRWSSAIEYRDGMAIWSVPKFSDNEVTFEGSVELTGSPASDGTSYSYELADSEDASNFNVTLTGSTHTAWSNVSQPTQVDGDSTSFSVGGTTSPRGPSANNEPTVTMTGSAPDERWSSAAPSDQIRATAAADSQVFVGDGGGVVTAVSKSDGSATWTFSGSSSIEELATDGSTVYAADSGGVFYALSASDGSELWNVSSASAYESAATNGSTVYAGDGSGTIYALSSSDGTEQWSQAAHGDSVDGLAADGSVVYSGSADNSVKKLDGSTGSESWSYSFSAYVTSVATNGNRVFAGSGDFTARAISASDGSEVWQYDYGNIVDGISVNGSDVFVSGKEYDIRMLDGDGSGTEVWTQGYGSRVLSVAADSENVYGGPSSSLRKTTYLTEDPSVTIDGSTVASHTGRLSPGETTTAEVSLSTGDHTLGVSTIGSVDVDLSIKEVTETIDPSVVINGDTYAYTGTLGDGNTTSLDVSTASLQSGTNTVNVSVSSSYDGPIGQVGLDYSHTATDAQSVDYEGETFSERYNISKTYASDRTGETLSIPWAGNVIDVRNLELRRDGGSWTTPSYTMADGTLEVEIGSVSGGETIEIRTTGTKINPKNGAITVTDPTVLGNELSSEVRIDEYSDGFALEVGGTISGNQTHYSHSESWSNPQTYARVGSGGSQELRFPNAGAGSTARISTIPLEPRPQDGHVDIRVRSAGSEPEFDVLESSSTAEVELVWYDTVSGATYQLYSLTADADVDRATANSPVTLTHDGSAETLAIFNVNSGSGGTAAGGTSTADTPPTMLIALALGGLLAIYLVSRRMGDDSVSGGMVLVAGSVLVGLLSIQAMAPGILARAIGAGLESTLPILIMGSIAIIIVWLRSRGDDVTLELGGGRQ